MKAKLLYAAAALLALTLAAGAAPRTGPKLTTVYRAQPNGEWQLFVFGIQPCSDPKNMQVIYPKDPATQPLEIECYLKGR